jgi:hypothetical protein
LEPIDIQYRAETEPYCTNLAGIKFLAVFFCSTIAFSHEKRRGGDILGANWTKRL